MRSYIKAALLIVAVTAVVFGWFHFKPSPAPVNQWTPANESPKLYDVQKQVITPPKVEVYAPQAKEKLNLPAAVQKDQNQHVIASTKIQKDTHQATVTTILNEQTGEVQTLVRREPLPWLAPEQTGELRIDVGIKNGLQRVGRLTLRDDLLQVKALHVGINASLDSDGQYFVGAGIGYRW